MNIRKLIDYTSLFYALDVLISQNLSQMQLYQRIGQLVSERSEKGAAVAAAEYLQLSHPDMQGFSPRNVRRMRDFYRAYQSNSSLTEAALQLGWSQNIVILENCHTDTMRARYLHLAKTYDWSKSKLLAEITADRDAGDSLDDSVSSCYTEFANTCTEEANGSRHLLQGTFRTAVHQGRLRLLQSSHQDERCEFAEYVPYLRWRFRKQTAPADGLYRPPWQCGKPVVHPRFQCNLTRC